MNDRPSVFGLLFLPGTVAGMLLAAVALEMARAVFPDAIEKSFPSQTLLVLLAATTIATSIVGLMSLYSPSQENVGKSQFDIPQSDSENKYAVPSGDNHAL